VEANIVRFPPACASDFVVHHCGVSYHVHKFVLIYLSAYFRTYIEQLIDGQRAYWADECDEHPSIAHCIRLPDDCGKVEASADDLKLFLCHLYFQEHYSCIPYCVVSHVDLATQPALNVTLTYPHFKTWRDLKSASSSLLFSSDPTMYDAVMSLCHYFDCARVLSQAEDNILLVVQVGDDPEYSSTRRLGGKSCYSASCSPSSSTSSE